ncbi:putative bifunctional diguanylate cyclase/phosphodiesterase [Sphaerotilus mobilis]|uniref:PAS domain S-box-containing protein/diguanylate cyclase (GGDEF)-like protein n=1 Tax=Sphaerotilus mobilis TaxID=47994 RepID=A0A4Q7LRJ9_9BURK|nr:GGDEF and EAL domain-containing protein [Sphaerotilus mobilis]RZS57101.1 PAS domain S-box-containing protein/diguanylate cyclase (GGDEF)-like protein [Sphaerotilus mobilis]
MNPLRAATLRSLAEHRMAARPPRKLANDEAMALLHELDVHQIELELQNEALVAAEGELQLAAAVFKHTADGLFFCDSRGLIVDVNPAFSRITGLAREAVLGKAPGSLSALGIHKGEFAQHLEHARWHGHWQGEVQGIKADGQVHTLRLSLAVVHDLTGQIQHGVGAFSDISHLSAHAAELDRMAHFDDLTGLPNRRRFVDRLNQAMARARRQGHLLAVCYLDLDGFKDINDRFGHAMGDLALLGVTRHLCTVLRAEDTLARIGGDEFVLLLDLADPDDCDAALARVMASLARPIKLGKHSLSVAASMGVTLFPGDDADADTLMRHADQAMYSAKEQGKNRVLHFDVQLARRAQMHREQQARLRLALVQGEFRVHFQPKIDLGDGRVVGVEALVRWQHPEQGLLPPLSFLANLQHTELDHLLGEWVLTQTLGQIERWCSQGLDLVASVNISPDHLLQPEFADRLAALLAAHPGVRPALLELEILESATVTDLNQAAATVSRCRELGVKVSLDDFGTGHSSLALLRYLPVDGLKIDQTFVRDLSTDRNDHALVNAVISLGAAFGCEVTAEGVETLDDAAELHCLGCRYAQGFGIARPMPVDRLDDWLDVWRAHPAWQGQPG